MALSELQDWIMRELGAKGETVDAMPARAGVGVEDMKRAVHGLRQRRYLEVIGLPNQNSYMGKDVDEMRLLSYGVGYLRTLR